VVATEAKMMRYDKTNKSRSNVTYKALRRGKNLSWANLSYVDLSKSYFENVNLHSARINDANLDSISIINSDLALVNLSNCNLERADFTGSDLVYANFDNVFAEVASFTNSNVAGASFRNAKLAYADFTGANLARVDFTNADLRNVIGNICTFCFGRHFAVAAGGYISIGCEKHSYQVWLSNYQYIGQKHGYTEDEIYLYGHWIETAIRFLQSKKKGTKWQ
jgi:hypothetical protein